jgi:hypothetical protein
MIPAMAPMMIQVVRDVMIVFHKGGFGAFGSMLGVCDGLYPMLMNFYF